MVEFRRSFLESLRQQGLFRGRLRRLRGLRWLDVRRRRRDAIAARRLNGQQPRACAIAATGYRNHVVDTVDEPRGWLAGVVGPISLVQRVALRENLHDTHRDAGRSYSSA